MDGDGDGNGHVILDCQFNEAREEIRVQLRDLLAKIPSKFRADCEKLHLDVLSQAENMYKQFLIQMTADYKKIFDLKKREMLTQLKSVEEISKMREEIVALLRSEFKKDQSCASQRDGGSTSTARTHNSHERRAHPHKGGTRPTHTKVGKPPYIHTSHDSRPPYIHTSHDSNLGGERLRKDSRPPRHRAIAFKHVQSHDQSAVK